MAADDTAGKKISTRMPRFPEENIGFG